MKKLALSITLIFALFITKINAITVFDPTAHSHLIENIRVLEQQTQLFNQQIETLKNSQNILEDMKGSLKTLTGARNVGDNYLSNLNSMMNFFDDSLTQLPSDVSNKYRSGSYNSDDLWVVFDDNLKDQYQYYDKLSDPYQYQTNRQAINHEEVKKTILMAQVSYEKTGKDFQSIKEQAEKVGKTEDPKEAQALTNSLLVGITQQLIELKQIFSQFINARMRLLYQEHQLQAAFQDDKQNKNNPTNYFDNGKKKTFEEQIEHFAKGFDRMGEEGTRLHRENCLRLAKLGIKSRRCAK